MTVDNKHLDLTSSFVHNSSSMPWGTYNTDTTFQAFQDSMIKYTYHKLGGDILKIELSNKDVWVSTEEAVLEYSAMINTYNAKSIMADIIGSATGSLEGKEQKLARMNLALANRKADAFSSEAMVGGTQTLYSASIALSTSQQVYDLQGLLSSSGKITGNQRVIIKEVFHFSPTAAYRFFDTSSAVNYLHNQFSFESFTPETVFYLLPVWEDVLRAQTLEMSHKIRRSNYSYDLINNVLKIYPVPTSDTNLFFTYYIVDTDPFTDADDPMIDGITGLNNVPFGNISFTKVNSIGKQWIRKFALALAKETLGQIRSKVGNIPIPNGDLTLNGADLIQQAREEQMNYRTELKEWLESMTYQKLAEQQRMEEENLKVVLNGVPMGIFVG